MAGQIGCSMHDTKVHTQRGAHRGSNRATGYGSEHCDVFVKARARATFSLSQAAQILQPAHTVTDLVVAAIEPARS